LTWINGSDRISILCAGTENSFLFFSFVYLFCVCAPGKTKNDVFKEKAAQRFFHPEINFKGKIIFQSDFEGNNEIYMISMKGLEKLTDNDWQDEYPVWSPDGKKIAFSANPNGNYDIFTMKADGSDIRQITTSSRKEMTPAWFQIWAVPLETKILFLK